MAYITGEATNHLNLLGILRDFLTSNGDLVGAGQEWEQIGGQTGTIVAGDFVSLRGPGLGGTDQILLSLFADSNAAAAHYLIGMRGHTAYNPSVPSFDPPGLNSPWVYVPLVNATIRYWIVANGRRFIMVAKSNNRYDVLYGGFMLPEHLPSDWPYPLLIGGSATSYGPNSDDSVWHSNFWRSPGNGYLFTPEQLWRTVENVYPSNNDNDSVGLEHQARGGLLMAVDWKTNIGQRDVTRTLDGQPWLHRGRLAQFSDDALGPRNFLGHFDGVFFTPSIGAVIEGVIEEGGKDYLVVANVFRNSTGQVAAICLE